MCLYCPPKHEIIADAFSSGKSIKKHERDFYENKNKQSEAEEEQEHEYKDETEENFPSLHVTYKSMIVLGVCNVHEMECMVHWCYE